MQFWSTFTKWVTVYKPLTQMKLEENPKDEYLAATACVIRSTVQTTLGASSAQLVYGRDMILPIQYKANWVIITLKKQKRIDKSKSRETNSN